MLHMKTFALLMILLVASLLLPAIPAMAQATLYLPVVAVDAPCRLVTEIPQDECEILVSVYRQTDGPNWLLKEDWLTDNHPCNWHGVRCEDGHVIYLSLEGGYMRQYCYGNGVHGPLPPEIANLSHLKALTSCYNTFTTSIPPEWGRLSNLEVLSFTFNTLSGPIPPELGNLSRLTVLNLRSNQHSGSIPRELGNLSELRILNLRGNPLRGQVPQEIGNLVQLEELDLEYTGPDLCIPSSLNAFTEGVYQYWPPDGGVCP